MIELIYSKGIAFNKEDTTFKKSVILKIASFGA